MDLLFLRLLRHEVEIGADIWIVKIQCRRNSFLYVVTLLT